ncbi:unnamed protein product, partial [Effrenium voratum]
YAAKFNKFIAEQADDPDVPQVKVCAPVGCKVLDSKIPLLTAPESHVLLFDFPAHEITKFMLDGTEDFNELAQSFFHYVAWASGSQASLFDLKGADVGNGDILLVDPCVLRADGEDRVSDNTREMTFEVLHRNCGPLCKAFDPQRRSAKVRRVCGVPAVPACGLK